MCVCCVRKFLTAALGGWDMMSGGAEGERVEVKGGRGERGGALRST